eukprot:403361278
MTEQQQAEQIKLRDAQMKEFQKKVELCRKELVHIANFITEKGLKIKQASTHENMVDYFRGDNFHQVVGENKAEILGKFKEIKTLTSLDTMEDQIKLGQMFIDFKLLIPLERHVHGADEGKKKYPKHLGPCRPQAWKMTDKGFYAWNTPKPIQKLAILLVIGVIITFAFMCFSIWPLWLKIGIWYFSFYTLIVLMGFIVLRLVVWLALFHFGVDFWILPNFFIDSNDIMDSFRPMLSFERRDDDFKMVILRIVSAVALAFFVVQLAKEPENLESLTSFTNENLNDLFNWGNDRFVLGQLPSQSGNSTMKRKKSPQEIFMEAILEEDETPKAAEEQPSTTADEDATTQDAESDTEAKTLDIDTLGLDDEEETASKSDKVTSGGAGADL